MSIFQMDGKVEPSPTPPKARVTVYKKKGFKFNKKGKLTSKEKT